MLASDETQLNGKLTEQRCEGLLFELFDDGVGPVECMGSVSDIGEAHAAAGMGLACAADGLPFAIGEGQSLQVATCTRLGLVAGESFVIEQPTSQFDLVLGDRVVCGDGRRGGALWE